MKFVALVFLYAATACPGLASTLRVPSEYPTIQSALDATHGGDTVLVALGTYAEQVQCPGRNFVLRGDVVPDTGDYPRPVIDPSTLSNPQTRTCLLLPSLPWPVAAVVEDFRFRNGPEMYPHSAGTIGGIMGGGQGVILRRCVVDSTAGGYFASGGSITLESCRFENIQGASAYATGSNFALRASDCVFHGRALFNIHVGDSSHFLRCRFLGNAEGSLCLAGGKDIRLEECVFGPSEVAETSWDPALWLTRGASGVVQNNVFEGLRLGQAAIRLQCACDDSSVMAIRNNRIVNNIVSTTQGSAGIIVDNTCPGHCRAQIADNVFERNHGNVAVMKAVDLLTDAVVYNNRFRALNTDLPISAVPAIKVHAEVMGAELQGNRFDSTGWAVEAAQSAVMVDGRYNWWGSPSGPYNAESNRTGAGDTVSAQVEFAPWCEDTAACDFSAADPEPARSLPNRFALRAYPNPFNSTTTIHFEVPAAEIVRVELFDLLGRRVQELWSGAVAERQEIALDGSGLSSGIYFLRVTNPIWNRPLVSAKIVLLK